MHEARLPALGRPITDISAAGLILSKGAARRDLQPRSDTRRENLEIVCLRAAEAGIPRREEHPSVRELQKLKHFLRVRGENLQLVQRGFGSRVTHQLDLVEFVNAQKATRILSRSSGFPAKTSRASYEALGKIRRVQNLVAIDVRDRYFRRRDQKKIVVAEGVHVVLELRELAGRSHRRTIDDDWYPQLLVTVVADVKIELHVHESAHQPGAKPPIQDESGAGNLGPTLEIDQTEFCSNVPVRRDTSLLSRCAPRCNDSVGFLAALGYLRECEVGYFHEGGRQTRLQCPKLILETGDLFAKIPGLSEQLVGAFARLFSAGHLLADPVSCGFALFRSLNHPTPVGVDRLRAVDDGRE